MLKRPANTISSIFMVPPLKIDKDQLLNNNFINAYSYDEMLDVQYDNCVYVLFHPNDLDRFRDFLSTEYDRTPFIVTDYDYANGFIVVVYKLDTNYYNDYELVRNGKYSKTSSSFQSLFPKIKKIIENGLHRDELSLQYRIFKRTEDLISFWENELDVTFPEDQEVWYKFDKNKETLTQEKLDELIKEVFNETNS